MSLLNEIITDLKENAAGGAGVTSAHNISGRVGDGSTGSIFRGMINRGTERNLKDVKRLKPANPGGWKIIGEMVDASTFDTSDVMSKLDASEKQANSDQDTTPFGLEDEDGNIVKVYVSAEQADEFEVALGSILAGETEDDDDEHLDSVEIAEVLFQLKDKFDIINVEWPKIEGDTEEEQEVAADDGDMDMEADGEMDLDGDDGMGAGEGDDLDMEGGEGEDDLDLEGGEDEMDLEGEDEMAPEGGAESALNQVIDMMKADAEARKAESEARAAEAEARAAEANSHSAASKVSQEEQVLDMEAYNTNQKSQKDETETLAKLAKHQHDMASGAEVDLAAKEEEEEVASMSGMENTGVNKTASAEELMKHLLVALRGNRQ